MSGRGGARPARAATNVSGGTVGGGRPRLARGVPMGPAHGQSARARTQNRQATGGPASTAASSSGTARRTNTASGGATTYHATARRRCDGHGVVAVGLALAPHRGRGQRTRPPMMITTAHRRRSSPSVDGRRGVDAVRAPTQAGTGAPPRGGGCVVARLPTRAPVCRAAGLDAGAEWKTTSGAWIWGLNGAVKIPSIAHQAAAAQLNWASRIHSPCEDIAGSANNFVFTFWKCNGLVLPDHHRPKPKGWGGGERCEHRPQRPQIRPHRLTFT